jgi:hypothetical protein
MEYIYTGRYPSEAGGKQGIRYAAALVPLLPPTLQVSFSLIRYAAALVPLLPPTLQVAKRCSKEM